MFLLLDPSCNWVSISIDAIITDWDRIGALNFFNCATVAIECELVVNFVIVCSIFR